MPCSARRSMAAIGWSACAAARICRNRLATCVGPPRTRSKTHLPICRAAKLASSPRWPTSTARKITAATPISLAGACCRGVKGVGGAQLAAAPEEAAIEMKVIVVRGIVVGPQHHMKIATGAGLHGAQEAPLRTRSLPVLGHADLAPAGQGESADVKGVGGGVLAANVFPERIADDVAAGVGAKSLDRRH